ncbi:MAG: DUF2232 domain-containing protein [Clostridiales bacterium]|nr:DUF2232 domain-containing protein [Clostridiales bacterium]
MAYDKKKTFIGILLSVLLALISAFVLPLYLLPYGFVWLIALSLIRIAFGRTPAYIGSVLMGAASTLLLGPLGGIAVALGASLCLFAVDHGMRQKGKLTEAVLYAFFALLFCAFCLVGYMEINHGGVIGFMMDTLKQSIDIAPQAAQDVIDSMEELYGFEIELDTLLYTMQEQLRLELPAQVVLYCLFGAFFSVLFSLKLARKLGMAEYFLKDEDILRWALPKGTGRCIAGSSLLCFACVYLFDIAQLQSAAYTLWQLFYGLFALQGMIALSFTMRMRGTNPAWRVIVPGLLFLILRPVLVFFGLFDRFSPIRKHFSFSMLNKDGTMKTMDVNDIEDIFRKTLEKEREELEKQQEDEENKDE